MAGWHPGFGSQGQGFKGNSSKDKVSGKGVGNQFGANADSVISLTLSGIAKENGAAEIISSLESITAMTKGVESQQAFDAFKVSAGTGESASGNAPEGMKWTFVDTFGTSDLVSLEPKEAQTGKAAYKAVASIQFKMVKSTKVSESDSELPALDAAKMKTFLAESRAAVQTLMQGKVNEKTLSVGLDKVIADIDRVIAMASKEDEGVSNRATVVRSAVTAAGNNTIKSAAMCQTNSMRCVQATLTYVERSISNYSEEAKKDEKK